MMRGSWYYETHHAFMGSRHKLPGFAEGNERGRGVSGREGRLKYERRVEKDGG